MQTILVDHHGEELKLELDQTPSARLFVNGIQRASDHAAATPCKLLLTSTVQTDYEWHEFVEATATFTVDRVEVSLSANNTSLIIESYEYAKLG